MSTEDFLASLRRLAEAADQVAAAYREQTAQAPAPTEEAAPFRHRDPDGDSVKVHPHPRPAPTSVLRVEAVEGGESLKVQVDLDQDAVNRLAQYLDGYRTDLAGVQTDTSVDCPQCGHEPHVSPCKEDVLDCCDDHAAPCGCQNVAAEQETLCAGDHPGREADRTGCPHARSDHGALGCVAYPECPCLRRGGR